MALAHQPPAGQGVRVDRANAFRPRRAAEIGLVNHVCPDDEVLEEAMACAHRIASLPKGAVEDTKRVVNIQLERAVLAALDFALSAEDRSFTSPELRANLDRLQQRERPTGD